MNKYPKYITLYILIISSLSFVSDLSAQMPSSGFFPVYGTVRINNPHRCPVCSVNILVEKTNAFGLRRWELMGIVQPNSYLDFFNVPQNIRIGLDAPAIRRQWPPFIVIYNNPKLFMMYTIPP
jgi:hypothetical protein